MLISTINIELLKVLGKEYIFQHCQQELKRIINEEGWKKYIADSLWCAGHNKALVKEWEATYLTPNEKPQETSEDVIKRICAKINAGG